MRCEKCGTDLPYDSVACYKCGTATDATFVRPSQQFSTVPKAGVVVGSGAIIAVVAAFAAILIAVVVFFTYQSNLREEAERRRNEQIETARKDAETAKQQLDELKHQQQDRERRQQEQLQRQQSNLTTDPGPVPVTPVTPDPRAISISAENIGQKGWWQPFRIPKGGGTLTGRLEGEGGLRGEFNVYVVNDEQLTDFRNGKSAQTYLTKQDLTVQDINVSLPAGDYYVLLQSSSGWTGRKVTGKLRIVN